MLDEPEHKVSTYLSDQAKYGVYQNAIVSWSWRKNRNRLRQDVEEQCREERKWTTNDGLMITHVGVQEHYDLNKNLPKAANILLKCEFGRYPCIIVYQP